MNQVKTPWPISDSRIRREILMAVLLALALVVAFGAWTAFGQDKATNGAAGAKPPAVQPEMRALDDGTRARLMVITAKLNQISAEMEGYRAQVNLEAQQKIAAKAQKYQPKFTSLQAQGEKIYDGFLASNGLKKEDWVFDPARGILKRKATPEPAASKPPEK